VRGLRRSTIRNYSTSVAAFCDYLTDPAYEWAAKCERRFGTHPVQVVHEWNTVVHVQDAEGDPSPQAFTLDELLALFDYADGQVVQVRATGRKGRLAAFRGAALFKVAYGDGVVDLAAVRPMPIEQVLDDDTGTANPAHAPLAGTLAAQEVPALATQATCPRDAHHAGHRPAAPHPRRPQQPQPPDRRPIPTPRTHRLRRPHAN
jgi:hypothetical protein